MVSGWGKGASLQLPSCVPKTYIRGKGKHWRKTEGNKWTLHLPASCDFLLCSQHIGQHPLENPVLFWGQGLMFIKGAFNATFFSSPTFHLKPKNRCFWCLIAWKHPCDAMRGLSSFKNTNCSLEWQEWWRCRKWRVPINRRRVCAERKWIIWNLRGSWGSRKGFNSDL